MRKSVILTLIMVFVLGVFAASAQDDATPIAYGESVTESLTSEEPEQFYSFEAAAGDFVDIRLTATNDSFDTYLYLFNEAGEEVEYNDDGGDGFNSRILGFEIPADGTYTIRATSFGYRDADAASAATGEFTLALNLMNLTPLEVNSSVDATLDTNEAGSLFFSFEGTEGDVVDLIVNSEGALDTRMVVIGPFGFEDNSNDDSAETVDPALFEYQLSYTGTYIVVVEPQNQNATLQGDLSVILATAELMSLEDGAMDVQLNDDRDQSVFMFEGVAGESVALTLEIAMSEDFASPTIEVLQGQETIASARNLDGVTNITFSFEVPADGAVNVSVSAYGDVNATLSFERLPAEE